MTKKRPTIDDVASLSGVARVTVSRVLNGGENVRAEVRERVLKAVEQLDYRVNVQARTLAGGSSQLVTIVHPVDQETEPNSYWESALELGALRACTSQGLQLVTRRIARPDWGERRWVTELIDQAFVEGIILTPPFSDDRNLCQFIADRGCALVCIAPGSPNNNVPATVGIDDERAGFEIADHLLQLGHRHFAFIGGLIGHSAAEQRWDGVLRAMREAGIPPSQIESLQGDFTFKSGVDLAREALAKAPGPTAIICANDDMAVGALFAAHKLGIEIPEHLSITGFDNTPVSARIWPPLTTIHQPIQEMGSRAVELIVEQLKRPNGQFSPHHERLDHLLIERESSAAPAGVV
ncbi:MAG: LacI family transcriptional regulator [Hyphomonadaceae bacterium BRH_c29]|nr:MAG: LacI family transcriptional regulator [Hyphomonadaceae bacterium BRH_c29]